MIRSGLLAFVLCLVLAGNVSAQQPHETVVLLHGLARAASSMEDMAEALREAGYAVENLDYPSTTASIEVLCKEHLLPLVRSLRAGGTEQIHFVTHSMGGILARQYLAEHGTSHIGRIVMLGPPNQGSELVDKTRSLPPFKWINGPAGLQLGTDAESLPKHLGPIAVPAGIIAGSRSYNPLYSSMIPGADDGKVSVNSARLEGMADFLILDVNHTFMMKDEAVIRQTVHFLGKARFHRP